jgi:hypothetical protein
MTIGINIDVINKSTGVLEISGGKFYSTEKAKSDSRK